MQVYVIRDFFRISKRNSQRRGGAVFKVTMLFVPKIQDRLQLPFVWRATGAKAKGVLRALFVVFAAFFINFESHSLPRFYKGLFIQRRERLQWRVRTHTTGAGEFGSGRIECKQQRERQRAFPKRIHAAAVAIFTRALGPREAAVNSVADACGNRRADTR